MLDTHALLWFLAGSARLGAAALLAINDPANEVWLSPMSLVEIALKVRINKLRLTAPFGVMFPAWLTVNGIRLWPVEAAHAAALATLPLHHRDPFDRLIAATALVEGLTLVSADTAFDAYGLTRLW
ncbi:MAG TPA: type II toxin-antitoxin system VapC family toxin [Gemmataceae bacterium]|nr:type II toxin-antitoxin system VapC family toxin [Gemmataceae bacterium]